MASRILRFVPLHLLLVGFCLTAISSCSQSEAKAGPVGPAAVEGLVQAIVDRAAPPEPFALTALVVRTSDGMILGGASSRPDVADYVDSLHGSGSTLKTIVLFAAGLRGVEPEDGVLGGLNCAFPDGGKSDPEEVPGPAVSIRVAARFSSDCSFRKLTRMVGPEQLAVASRTLGIERPLITDDYFAIGANSISPRELATVYVSLFQGQTGEVTPPGSSRQPAPGSWTESEMAARDATVDSLRDVLVSGTAAGSAVPGHDAIGKTGTSSGPTNVWFAGGTPQYVVAVWAGDPEDRNRPLPPMELSGGSPPTGGTYAARIWQQIMSELLAGLPNAGVPEGEYARPPVLLVDPAVDCTDENAEPYVDDVAPFLPHLPAGTVGFGCSALEGT